MGPVGEFLLVVLKWLLIFGVIGWFLYGRFKRTEDERFISKLIVTAALIPLIIASIVTGMFGAILAPFFAIVLAFMWGPNIGRLIASPITSALDGGNEPPEARPFYSISEARRKQGRYEEAIVEVRKQLDRFPTDFKGWLLLAQIQAEDLKDLDAAQVTIERILNQEGHSPNELSHALTRLADWHLAGGDIEAARQCFERIADRFPTSDLAQVAQQRIAHLVHPERPGEASRARRIQLGEYEQKLGLKQTHAETPVDDYATRASSIVQHLEEYPLDAEAREDLARIYADNYHRLDLATEQLEQLVNLPNQAPKQVAHWLGTLADLHLKFASNLPAARGYLERIMDRFPNTALAEQAAQRIAYLKLESKAQEKSQVIRLGTYEQNIGLKKDWPTV